MIGKILFFTAFVGVSTWYLIESDTYCYSCLGPISRPGAFGWGITSSYQDTMNPFQTSSKPNVYPTEAVPFHLYEPEIVEIDGEMSPGRNETASWEVQLGNMPCRVGDDEHGICFNEEHNTDGQYLTGGNVHLDDGCVNHKCQI